MLLGFGSTSYFVTACAATGEAVGKTLRPPIATSNTRSYITVVGAILYVQTFQLERSGTLYADPKPRISPTTGLFSKLDTVRPGDLSRLVLRT